MVTEIPQFKLYGADDPIFSERIQPRLEIRPWSKLSTDEKTVMYEDLHINFFGNDFSNALVLHSVEVLNHRFTRRQLAFNVNKTKVSEEYFMGSRMLFYSAHMDFKEIFIDEQSEDLVLLMLSLYADQLIDKHNLYRAKSANDSEERKRIVVSAFRSFDNFAKRLNHLFEQFGVNIFVTRSGFVPRQDERIVKEIYKPTLEVLSDPKWDSVNSIFREVFADFHVQRYPEAITKAHNAVHQFLKIVLSEEGSSGKGQFGKLIQKAKSQGIISGTDEIQVLIKWITGFLPSERANKGSAKPTLQAADSADALLVMNVALVLIQHCLQNLEDQH